MGYVPHHPLACEPLPDGANELAAAVRDAIDGWRTSFYREEVRAAAYSYERSIVRAEVRRLGGDPDLLPRANGPWTLPRGAYGPAGDRLAAEQAADRAAWQAAT